ncbi:MULTISPECIES: hypothetical protein [unclassified Lentimonas]|uniref:hypothetical protein n=1 Tax=unclassified Lentimonas TaxID=2630993 RepID=UPI00132A3604|nr:MULTISPECIES: hypothetical protein [unclassified Lentimonas]CAA6679863.1 Unannotated [Lentimonas sp. CC4]CAA6685623.1 Unannotated [Lentimonas sp. CC6]CAA6689625.1 Unannotated [Lentimonas sp. CC19]CAA6692616.1 Unannotated [Lentimonas sp. CC10]CAA7069222.1 Unannotated [Lentimonas sp. CC11]
MQKLELELAEGWSEVAPRAGAPSLLVEDAGRLFHLSGDLSLRYDLGEVGVVECPIAYDPLAKKAYRYVCASGLAKRDYSELRAYDLEIGSSETVLSLPLNRWVLWQLEWIASQKGASGQLFGLIATDRPSDDRVVIEHQLFALRPGEQRCAYRPLCQDAYRPLAFSQARRQMIFAGAEGVYLVGLNGQRLLSAPLSEGHGKSGCFAPDGSAQALISCEGVHLWNLESNRCARLLRAGHYPVWSADGAGFWFRRSGADLQYYDFKQDAVSELLTVKYQHQPELWNARGAVQSPCGRYLALGVTGKRLRGVSRKQNATGAVERVYTKEHRIVVMDLKQRELWHAAGQANQLTWGP